MKNRMLALLLVALVVPVSAEEAHVGRVAVAIPPQYSSLARATPNPAVETIAYSVPGEQGVPTNVLQLTRYNLGDAPADRSAAGIAKGTETYLLQMLGGIERRRTSYSQAAPESIRLGGQPGLRASWKGSLQGAPTNGTMYCLIVGSDVILLHAFGGGGEPDEALDLAKRAIEGLRVEPNKD